MNILAYDTSTSACSIVLKTPKGIFQFHEIAPRKHNELMLPEIEKLLMKANISVSDVEYMSYGVGPGSFVGVRLAAAITQGLAFANNTPVVPFSSMLSFAVVALETLACNKLSVIVDAKVNDLYVGDYQLNKTSGLLEIIKEFSVKIDEFKVNTNAEVYVGDGCHLVAEKLKGAKVEKAFFYPNAKLMLPYIEEKIAKEQFMDAVEAQPVYLQGTKNWKKVGE